LFGVSWSPWNLSQLKDLGKSFEVCDYPWSILKNNFSSNTHCFTLGHWNTVYWFGSQVQIYFGFKISPKIKWFDLGKPTHISDNIWKTLLNFQLFKMLVNWLLMVCGHCHFEATHRPNVLEIWHYLSQVVCSTQL